jgi:hypothetical protein
MKTLTTYLTFIVLGSTVTAESLSQTTPPTQHRVQSMTAIFEGTPQAQEKAAVIQESPQPRGQRTAALRAKFEVPRFLLVQPTAEDLEKFTRMLAEPTLKALASYFEEGVTDEEARRKRLAIVHSLLSDIENKPNQETIVYFLKEQINTALQLAALIDEYIKREARYVGNLEQQIIPQIATLDPIVQPTFQKRFTDARFHHLIARCFIELKEKDLELLKLYTDQKVKDRILQEHNEYGLRRAKAMFDQQLKQLDDPQQKNVFKQRFKGAQKIDAQIEKHLETGFTPQVKKNLANAIKKLPSPIKEVLMEKLKKAQQQAGLIATIKMFIEQGSKDDAQSQLANVKNIKIRDELAQKIEQMKPAARSL